MVSYSHQKGLKKHTPFILCLPIWILNMRWSVARSEPEKWRHLGLSTELDNSRGIQSCTECPSGFRTFLDFRSHSGWTRNEIKIVTTQQVRWAPMQILFGLITQSSLGGFRDKSAESLHRRLQVKLPFIHPSVSPRTKRTRKQTKRVEDITHGGTCKVTGTSLSKIPISSRFSWSIHEHSRAFTSIYENPQAARKR